MFTQSLIYSSDLIIRDPRTLASLCVFFDNIYLPHVADLNAGILLRVTESDTTPDVDLVDLPSAGEFIHRWDESHAALYATSVLKRLPNVSQEVEIDADALEAIVNQLEPNVSGFSRRLYLLARVVHHLRSDHPAPHLIDPEYEAPTRDGYKWLMAHEAFAYLIPSLNELTPEQILEVREKVADTREGFSMHLQQLSREVERRTSDGEPIESIKLHARSVIETELIPDFAEFRRQLSAERAGFWGKLLNMAATSFRLLVPATGLDFAASGFTTLSAVMAITGDQRKLKNTNSHLAYQFLSKVKSDVEVVTQKGK